MVQQQQTNSYYLDVIKLLLEKEEVLLYERILTISQEEEESVSHYLQQHYKQEAANYPFEAPPFNHSAALWASKVVYISAQLILYRSQNKEDLSTILPLEEFAFTPSNILSVDLCLRFLPSMCEELELIDYQDILLPTLKKILSKWHYSKVGLERWEEMPPSWDTIAKDPCLLQMYTDRIIQHKHKQLAAEPLFNNQIKAAFGLHGKHYWAQFLPLKKGISMDQKEINLPPETESNIE